MKTRVLNRKTGVMYFLYIIITGLTLSVEPCSLNAQDKQSETVIQVPAALIIKEQEVLDKQKIWGDGIVQIGKIYTEKEDYRTAASNLIDELYGFNMGIVLFKPTMASQKQFRTSKEGALSYFIGGNPDYPEDHGFAIKPWSKVRWENIGIKIAGNMAIAMGNYYFTPADGGLEVKVEYSFAYTKDKNGRLRIILHDSHFPYTPGKEH